MKRKQKICLILILVLATFLRFWRLDQVPPSPDWDEAALGWNAYSLMETGRDEYGQLLPFFLRSFDDYKPAFYAYLAILPIKFFGLNLWATRFPSALLGVLSVWTSRLFGTAAVVIGTDISSVAKKHPKRIFFIGDPFMK